MKHLIKLKIGSVNIAIYIDIVIENTKLNLENQINKKAKIDADSLLDQVKAQLEASLKELDYYK